MSDSKSVKMHYDVAGDDFAVGVAGNFQQFVIVFFSHFFCL